MPFSLWELLGTDDNEGEEKQYILALWLIKEHLLPENWKAPSSGGTYVTYIETPEEIEKLMKEKPRGKQAILKGAR